MPIALITVSSLKPGDWEFHLSFLIVHSSAILGVFFGSEISQRLGRVRCFIISNAIYLLTTAFCITGYLLDNQLRGAIVILNRILIGVITGIYTYITPLYSKRYSVREMAPNELSGRMVATIGVMETIGFHFANSALGYFAEALGNDLAVLLFLIPTPVAILQTALFLFHFKHESPSFMWISNRRKEAISLVNMLYLKEMNQDISYEVRYI
jgi:MFS family permease